tara:strand:- start:1599 stop:2363 length:765 start_codon:yes stop_codon:yes gene_type:complete
MVLDKILKRFDCISLVEMDSVKLMNRIDSKFIFSINDLHDILLNLENDYSVLNVNNKLTHSYESLYFDDENDRFFRDHHRGKKNRFKVRYRQYVDSKKSYLEVKHKKNGRTFKRRVLSSIKNEDLSLKQIKFVRDSSIANIDLQKSISTSYQRITLVSLTPPERITLDLSLSFSKNGKTIKMSDIAIAELKQSKIDRNSPFYKLMKKKGKRPIKLSKYILGRIILKGNEKLKYNRFKITLLQLNKIRKNEYHLV